LTNWEHESIDPWIEKGMLASHAMTLRGRPCRVAMPALLLAFNRRYIPISNLAKLVGVKAGTMTRRISALDVIAAKKAGRGNTRGALAKSAEAAEMAVKVAAIGTLEIRDGRTGGRTWKRQ